ncbi:MAG: magnesium transporter CorA family protein [Chloroflexaceae bacterium]|nr:magnesium transporter CorA family protein [Chloroflexaceae bacterium]
MIVRTRHPGERSPSSLPQGRSAAQQELIYQDLKWLDLVKPGSEQIAHLRHQYQFHPLHLEDVLSRLQRPKIDDNPESEREYVFLVLHFPVFDKTNRLAVTSEVDIFAGHDYVITLHDGKLKPLTRLVKSATDSQARAQLMGGGSGYLLYRIIETLMLSCFPMSYRIDQHLDRIEAGIFGRNVHAIVQELSFIRRDIIAMRRIIRPNIPVVRSLEKRERTFLRLDEEVYFGDLTDGLDKLWDMLEEQKEIIEGLNATLDSLTSHRINEEMKIFTLISVIMLPMTLVASIFGMNVPIPLGNEPLGFPIALVILSIPAMAMYLYFRYKHWV